MMRDHYTDPAYIAHLEAMAEDHDAYIAFVADHQEHELERMRAWG